MADAHGIAAVQEEHGRLGSALALVFRDPGRQLQFAVTGAVEDLVGIGRRIQQFVFVGRRALLQQLGAEMVADLGVVVLGKARLVRDIESCRHARQDKCTGKTRQYGTALMEKRILFKRAHNAPIIFPACRICTGRSLPPIHMLLKILPCVIVAQGMQKPHPGLASIMAISVRSRSAS